MDLIITILISLIFFVLGYQIKEKQKIGLIHSYHYKRVKEQDVHAYTRLMGISMYIIGTSILGFCVLQYDFVLIIGLVIAFLVINKAQRKYNGGWFS